MKLDLVKTDPLTCTALVVRLTEPGVDEEHDDDADDEVVNKNYHCLCNMEMVVQCIQDSKVMGYKLVGKLVQHFYATLLVHSAPGHARDLVEPSRAVGMVCMALV